MPDVKPQSVCPDWDEALSVILPTFCRPDGIRIALPSLEGQTPQGRAMEVIVVDNDPKASARAFVNHYAAQSDLDIIYIHEPDAGVSNARNTAMAAVRGRFVAFLDDDMEALPGWAQALIDTAERLDAGLVFGPAIANFPDPDDPRNQYLEPYFSRRVEKPDEGLITKTLGTGGCLVDRQRCRIPSPPFNPNLNEVGGEDDLFFAALRAGGARVGWSPRAKAWEHVPPQRTTDSYIWKRNFAFGQGPIHIHAENGWRGAPHILRYMLTGTLQIVWHGLAYAALKLLNVPSYVTQMARLARGCGKVFWADQLSPKLYGAAALQKAESLSASSPAADMSEATQ